MQSLRATAACGDCTFQNHRSTNHPPTTHPVQNETFPLTPITLFLAFLKAGGCTIGGGYATLAPLRRLIVESHAWMTEEDFASCTTAAQAMPGVLSLNLAACMGRRLMGATGIAMAMLGMVLPPFVVMVIVATFFDSLRALPAVSSFLRGARPAIVAVILIPVFSIIKHSQITLSTIWIPIGAAIAIVLLGISPVYIIAGFVALGIMYALLVQMHE